jgi:hypothetical protein
MSNKSKLAVITAASIGMVLTQNSAARAEIEGNTAPEKVTRIAVPINVDEEILYSALPDDVLEKAAGSGVHVAAGTYAQGCSTTAICSNAKPVKKPPSSSSKKPNK